MASKSGKTAHARLTALAQRRRRFAKSLPGPPPLARRRWHDEIARVYRKAVNQEEPGPTLYAWTLRNWRSGLAWIGVAAAVVILVWVIRFPESTPQLAASSPSTVREAIASTPVADGTELSAEIEMASPAASSVLTQTNSGDGPPPASRKDSLADPDLLFAVRGLGDAANQNLAIAETPPPAASPPRPATLSPSSPGLAQSAESQPTARGRPQVDLRTAQRLRRSYRAELGTGTLPPALLAFEVVRDRQSVEVRDADGSVYTGRVATVNTAPGEPPQWSCEVRGFSRSLQRTIQITGNFGAHHTAAETAVAANVMPPPSEDFLELPFNATVLVDGNHAFEVRARPVDP